MLVVITICLVLITIALVFGSDAAKGFIGFILTINVYWHTFKKISKSKNTLMTKFYFCNLLILHFLTITIGYQYASIMYWLTFLPNGLLTSQLTFEDQKN